MDYEALDNSLEVLPKAPDGSYYHDHLKGFSEITRIIKAAKRYRETGETDDYVGGQATGASVSRYARDPHTGKDITNEPTARTVSESSLVQPAYKVSFKNPKPDEPPKIQHSNELSLDELRQIKEDLKKNPKKYVSKGATVRGRARRSFK